MRFRGGVEQPLLGEFPPPRLEQRHQRPDSGELDGLDHDLVARFAGEGGEFADRDDLEPLLRLQLHALERGAPDDGVEARIGVLEAEIGVAGGMGTAEAGNLAPDPHEAEPILDRALERAREFADGDLGRIGCARVRFGHRRIMPDPGGRSHKRGPAVWRHAGKLSMKRPGEDRDARLVRAAMPVFNPVGFGLGAGYRRFMG